MNELPLPGSLYTLMKPLVALDDGPRGGQPETGPLSRVLRREKRLEDLVHHLGGHPRPRIGHLQKDIPTRPCLDVHARVILVDPHVLGGDGEMPAARHRIPRVHAEVHEDLVELREVPLDGPEVPGGIRVELDGPWKCLPHDVLDLPHQVPDLHLRVITRGAAGEAEDLLHDAGPPLGGRPDDVEDPL